MYLEQAGYQVVTIQDVAQVMPAFRHERPDLNILDLMLPHLDGWEICRQIRRESGTPIIMLTARSEESSTHAASILIDNGFKKAIPILGGFEAWRNAGYPVEPKLSWFRIGNDHVFYCSSNFECQ
ncbi:MAG: hypothetical protein A2Z16_02075 [Chloroflexi bacterium RBG_16_54_18]|nr:MAG: hypothetical protein A2Z16_02075 [Chloroflexi bacterium RBG_16_54_18]